MTTHVHGWTLIAILTAPLALGCQTQTPPLAPPGGEHAHEHDHPSEGPHHGDLIELGQEEYHAELTHDDATQTVTVYLLDKSATDAVPIADAEITLNLIVDGKPVQAKLAAAPQEGDPPGEASRFSLTDAAVMEAIEFPKTTGRINVTIGGKPFTGEFTHHEHGEHNHQDSGS
jgi:hypothetical protein